MAGSAAAVAAGAIVRSKLPNACFQGTRRTAHSPHTTATTLLLCTQTKAALAAGGGGTHRLSWRPATMPVRLFPNWVVKHIRTPHLQTSHWLKRPVEVFLVSPKMSKLEIKEYLRKLYNLPVTAVPTANYMAKERIDQETGRKYKVRAPGGRVHTHRPCSL